MSLLGSILGGLAAGSGRRSYGYGGWNRGRSSYGRRPMGLGYGRSRASSGSLLGGTLGRMAIGGLTAYGMRRFLGGGRPYNYY